MSHNYYKIMRIAVRENDPVWQAIHEVVADEDNKFGKTIVWSFSSGDIDVYIIPIYYGKYWKRRFEALTGIGFHEITPEDLKEVSEYINTSEVFFKSGNRDDDAGPIRSVKYRFRPVLNALTFMVDSDGYAYDVYSQYDTNEEE
jgi:hypothetical protein